MPSLAHGSSLLELGEGHQQGPLTASCVEQTAPI